MRLFIISKMSAYGFFTVILTLISDLHCQTVIFERLLWYFPASLMWKLCPVCTYTPASCDVNVRVGLRLLWMFISGRKSKSDSESNVITVDSFCKKEIIKMVQKYWISGVNTRNIWHVYITHDFVLIYLVSKWTKRKYLMQ